MSEVRPEFEEFVVARGPALVRFGYLLTGDAGQAEDLVQDALVKAFRRWSGDVAVERPEAYVRRIIVNDVTSWRRRRSSTEVVGSVPDYGHGDAAEASADRDVMWRALAELPRRQRAVMVLRYYENLPDSEIAGVLGCGASTVRSLASRAFAALRRRPDLRGQTRDYFEETT